MAPPIVTLSFVPLRHPVPLLRLQPSPLPLPSKCAAPPALGEPRPGGGSMEASRVRAGGCRASRVASVSCHRLVSFTYRPGPGRSWRCLTFHVAQELASCPSFRLSMSCESPPPLRRPRHLPVSRLPRTV
ncbi:hypothetical protein TGRUB_362100 [Toxoplasma gondii RUB]|uniref:Uncharacterized protein n=2 Tax=Toxoplasma gondii TaxID=5811 RepID=A0A086LXJ3_TOXGO|nr:hypothetical protein TGRUB_362100 [Toxoplasma gondii RUB]PUA87633.1 hypothetical protein TGBR9_362100 [Toxoplasma gondii TgCATBr9]